MPTERESNFSLTELLNKGKMILLPPLSSLSVQPPPFLAWRSGIAVALWSIHLICVVHFTYFSCVTKHRNENTKKNTHTFNNRIAFSFFLNSPLH